MKGCSYLTVCYLWARYVAPESVTAPASVPLNVLDGYALLVRRRASSSPEAVKRVPVLGYFQDVKHVLESLGEVSRGDGDWAGWTRVRQEGLLG